ncbi:MAG: peptidylprolyl isomerase [Candidatus Thermoplasmatota archaeon]|nr:peptidylprolyl isomerase [Candidatus Thermoplasmatota archaeon]MDI6887105.1 peptidylprolyl isomerase [Candidatus Thermoplasmatota archaeon]
MRKGDIVYLEYDMWLKENNRLVETTNEELAKAENIWHEKKRYGAIPVVVGAGEVVKGIDEVLANAELGKDYELELLPAQAYGEREARLVEIFSIHEFKRQKLEPKVGMEVSIKGKVGLVTAVTAGRVRVDFNHKYAGKTIKYRYKIIKKAETELEKAQALIEAYYGNAKDFDISISESKDATIKLPDVCKYDTHWLVTKYKIISALREFVGLTKISFIEEYIKKEAKQDVDKPSSVVAEQENAKR